MEKGKIGVFDSGFGGLTILKEFSEVLPNYDFIYLSDNRRAPYGGRSQKEIFEFTLESVKKLFSLGADLVILACNTASSAALRKIQQEVLIKDFPNKKVLGIIIPTSEEIGKVTFSKKIGVLATEATVESNAYEKEIKKYWPDIEIFSEACPLLVPIIEAGETDWEGLNLIAKKYLNSLFQKNLEIDTVILGCTHYAIIKNQIIKLVDSRVKIFSQGKIVADKLKDYLERHSEIDNNLTKTGKREFFTTSSSDKTKKLFKLFYGDNVEVKEIIL